MRLPRWKNDLAKSSSNRKPGHDEGQPDALKSEKSDLLGIVTEHVPLRVTPLPVL